jgi:hypothetical protein
VINVVGDGTKRLLNTRPAESGALRFEIVSPDLCRVLSPRGRFDFALPVYSLTSAPPGAGQNSTAPASRAPRVAPST